MSTNVVHRRARLLVVAAVASALLAAGCTHPPPPSGGPIGNWRVTVFFDGTAQQWTTPVPGSTFTLSFNTDGTVSGVVCNGYRGSWSADGARLSVDDIVATKKACATPPGITEQEGPYLDALDYTNTWQVVGDTLRLSACNDPCLSLVEAVRAP